MNKSKTLAIAVLILSLASSWGQQALGVPRPTFPPAGNQDTPTLTRFNLNFPGGSPQDLVAAITEASGKPLNAVINAEDAVGIKLPPLKMNNVNVAQLFEAVHSASMKTEMVPVLAGPGPGYSYQQITSGFGFKTTGTPTDDSVWYFYVQKLAPPPKPQPPASYCRFYLMTPYLERGLTVDDITTAIQTAWTMLGNTPGNDQAAPQISYHKETKLLIAVGEPSRLETIDAVLKALEPKAPTSHTAFQDNLKRIVDNAASANSNQSNTNH